MTENRFRLLILLYLIFSIVTLVVSLTASYSDALSAAFEQETANVMLQSPWVLLGLGSLLLLIAWLVALAGLLLFKRWARGWALYTSLALLTLHPLTGPSLSSGLENALLETTNLLWGAILALAYFSPIAESFKPKPRVEAAH